jgi:hypothetical protein
MQSPRTLPTQVLFYDPAAARDFGFAWQAKDAANRWLFPVQQFEDGPVRFVYYILKRLQDQGKQAGTVLFATNGLGALFSVAPGPVQPTSKDAVGLLPGNVQPFDFGTTVAAFAPKAQTTMLSSSVAADNTYQGTTYKGSELVGLLAIYIDGATLGSDAAVAWQADGSAVTTGNIWQGDPLTGEATIKYPAPGGGNTQPFPL